MCTKFVCIIVAENRSVFCSALRPFFLGVNRFSNLLFVMHLYSNILEYIYREVGVSFGGICCNFCFIISFLVPY